MVVSQHRHDAFGLDVPRLDDQRLSEKVTMNITDFKRCSKCKDTKHRDLFAAKTAAKDGKQDWCKQCVKDHRAAKIAAAVPPAAA